MQQDYKFQQLQNSLEKTLKEWSNTEFTFDRDCVTFTLTYYRDLTGVDVLHLFNGMYNSREEAIKWLEDRNYTNIDEAVTDILGLTPKPAIEAKYGDLVSFYFNDIQALGVCKGARAYFVAYDNKDYLKVPIRKCKTAWSVN